jgi:hypothetical protein
MSGQRVRRLVSDTAGIVILFAANATKPVLHSRILLSGAFAASLLVVGVPILFEADVSPVAADGTLKCYDGAGNHEPCATQANTSPERFSASPARFNGSTAGALRPPSWTTAALYEQSSWAIAAADQQPSWTTAEADQSANPTSAPIVRHGGGRWGRHQASASCRRHLIPCFLATLRRGLTHIASAAASAARPAREHL